MSVTVQLGYINMYSTIQWSEFLDLIPEVIAT